MIDFKLKIEHYSALIPIESFQIWLSTYPKYNVSYIVNSYYYSMNDEVVKGVIPNLKSGFMGRGAQDLVVTERRLIFGEYITKLVKRLGEE